MDGMDEDTIGTVAPKATPAESPELQAEKKRMRRMAYYGIRPGTVGRGTPDVFLDDASPPVFHFLVMTGTDSQEFDDLFYTERPGASARWLPPAKYAEAARWLLDRKLLPWEGYTDKDGQPIFLTFASDPIRAIDAECYASIPVPLRLDLMRMILDANMTSQKESAGVKS